MLTKELLVGVPLPTFLLTHRVRSSTISTSIILWVKPLYFFSLTDITLGEMVICNYYSTFRTNYNKNNST